MEKMKSVVKDEFKTKMTMAGMIDFLKESLAFESFRSYLITERSEENLDFWLEVAPLLSARPRSRIRSKS